MKLKEITKILNCSYRVISADGSMVDPFSAALVAATAEVAEVELFKHISESALNDIFINIKLLIKIDLTDADISELLDK